MLVVSKVSKRYGAKKVLDSADAEISAHGITLLSGANGSGKTTLIRCILGLENFSGEITWGGSPARPSRQSFFPVFDDMPLHRRLTGAQNLRVLTGDSALSGPFQYLDEEALGHRVATYSYGQRKRLVLTAALNSEAPYVLLDEPMNGLDYDTVARLREDLRTLAGSTGFLITGHNMEAADSLVDEAFMLSGGKISRVAPATFGTEKECQPCDV